MIAGRAGYDYDYEQREDGTGKDLVKTGIKMKTEGEFGFEPVNFSEQFVFEVHGVSFVFQTGRLIPRGASLAPGHTPDS